MHQWEEGSAGIVDPTPARVREDGLCVIKGCCTWVRDVCQQSNIHLGMNGPENRRTRRKARSRERRSRRTATLTGAFDAGHAAKALQASLLYTAASISGSDETECWKRG